MRMMDDPQARSGDTSCRLKLLEKQSKSKALLVPNELHSLSASRELALQLRSE